MTEMLSCCREFSLVMRSVVHQSRQVGLHPIQVSCLPPSSSSYPQNLKLPQIITPNTSRLQALKAKPTDGSSRIPKTKEQKWLHEGLITESLPNGMFWVRLDNDDMILGYVSGKIRQSKLRILPGDKVEIEVSRYDSTRGRITYRLRNKDPNS